MSCQQKSRPYRIQEGQLSERVTAHTWPLIAVAFVVLIWFIVTPGIVPELVFPSPEAVWKAATRIRFGIIEHAAWTFTRVVGGWVIGVSLGVVFGLLMMWSRTFFSVTNPFIEAIRPLSPIILIPFFIIWFGLSVVGQVALIALGCFMVMVVNTYVAVSNLSPTYLYAAQALGARKGTVYRTVILPGIFPELVSGFRIAAALAFGVGIAAEFMGAQSGLGFLIMVARRTLNTDIILLGTIVIAMESYVIDIGLRLSADYLTRWADRPRSALERLGPGTWRWR